MGCCSSASSAAQVRGSRLPAAHPDASPAPRGGLPPPSTTRELPFSPPCTPETSPTRTSPCPAVAPALAPGAADRQAPQRGPRGAPCRLGRRLLVTPERRVPPARRLSSVLAGGVAPAWAVRPISHLITVSALLEIVSVFSCQLPPVRVQAFKRIPEPSYDPSSKREWKPLEDRSCTDIPWLLLFILFCIGMGFICGFSVATGAAARLVSGYDSYGNICGQKNAELEAIPNSGMDHTHRKYVFFLDPCNLDLINRKIKSVALCVAACPRQELKTISDVQKFAEINGSALCSYDLKPSEYASSKVKGLCPKLPVPASAPIPFFHRCAPVNISCYAKFAEALITFVSDNSVLHRLISGVMTSKEIILGLCLLSLVLSMILMVIIRYISRILVWILTFLLILGSLGGTGVLWWLYAKQRKSPKETVIPDQPQVAEANLRALLIYAISATVFTVILFLVMLVMRKRVALTIALFHVAGKVFIHLPLLVFQPFWTFFALVLFWVYWIMTLLFLGTAGSAVQNEQGFVEFKMSGPLQYMWWYHVVGLIWISEFILACQQMTVAGAVVTYYFTRDKRNLPFTPILASVNRLIRYHLGTVAKGSFIITLVKIPRMILMYIHSQLKGKENACARCVLKSCICCLWCLEKCLNYLNQNAYTATAINSTNFCTSAKDAFVILVENALRVAAINTVGDFMLFLGKVLIVCSTGLAGVMLLNYQQDYTVWVLPLIIVCLFAFLVAHCFLSIYEMVVDVLFLCFAVDTKYNDGSPGREFYMDKVLMEFVENSRKAMKEAGKGGAADARELKPMASGASSA
ncbi:choline transporter-like protein 1 [Capricornis sumatraensis]